DYLRYYFASKLAPNVDDIDLSFLDFIAKVNSDLVGKVVNIASRCAGFVNRLGGGRLAAELARPDLFAEFTAEADAIAADYDGRNYGRAMRRIMALADRANQYIDAEKPWIAAKDESNRDAVLAVCTQGLNLFRILVLYLTPVLPELAARAEQFLAIEPLAWSDAGEALLDRPIDKFRPLLQRVEPAAVEAIVDETRSAVAARSKESTMTLPVDTETAAETAEIDIELFSRIDLRVARVVQAEHVEGADKLLKLTLDTGGATRTVFAGIRKAYEPSALESRLGVLEANLRPRKMCFC